MIAITNHLSGCLITVLYFKQNEGNLFPQHILYLSIPEHSIVSPFSIFFILLLCYMTYTLKSCLSFRKQLKNTIFFYKYHLTFLTNILSLWNPLYSTLNFSYLCAIFYSYQTENNLKEEIASHSFLTQYFHQLFSFDTQFHSVQSFIEQSL